MPYPYSRSIKLAIVCVTFSAIFAGFTVKLFKPSSRASVFLRDMTSSYAFLDDVYLSNLPALRGRLENWANHIHSVTSQSICLSAKFSNFQESPEVGVSVSVCSADDKLSELARGADDSGIVDVFLGEMRLGEIEWLTKTRFDFSLFLVSFLSYLLFSVVTWGMLYFVLVRKSLKESQPDSLHATDMLRSLYRIMSSNRRTMAFHDNWVYGERSHPYINFVNLDGSKLRLRASLSDVVAIFPSARFINRSTIVNTSVGVHQIKDNKVVLKIKTGELEFDIEPSYGDAISG